MKKISVLLIILVQICTGFIIGIESMDISQKVQPSEIKEETIEPIIQDRKQQFLEKYTEQAPNTTKRTSTPVTIPTDGTKVVFKEPTIINYLRNFFSPEKTRGQQRDEAQDALSEFDRQQSPNWNKLNRNIATTNKNIEIILPTAHTIVSKLTTECSTLITQIANKTINVSSPEFTTAYHVIVKQFDMLVQHTIDQESTLSNQQKDHLETYLSTIKLALDQINQRNIKIQQITNLFSNRLNNRGLTLQHDHNTNSFSVVTNFNRSLS